MPNLSLTSYYRHPREDVLAHVPTTARTILDVGCGAGALGARLLDRQPCEVWGIEPDPDAAQAARRVLTRVFETRAEDAAKMLPSNYFDALITADIIEHLPNPWSTLQALARALAPQATIVISLPNLQHHNVIRDLSRGRFTYVPAGILDHTHLRFFTRRSAIELVERAGFEIVRIIPRYSGKADRHAARRRCNPSGILVPPDAHLEDLYATQFVIVARAGRPYVDLRRIRVSIVMLTFNRQDVTRQAIASVFAAKRQPDEMIIVDNGSTDGTLAYLSTLRDNRVRVLQNPVNRGVSAGWNAGLSLATGDCLMVLNNDVVVAGDWLARMIRTAYEVPNAGLVGCRTNIVTGPQALSPDYNHLEDFPLFARRYADLADRSWFELSRIVAVAMLWRRDLYEGIGLFDEQFSPAGFEDDDYSLRALAAGYCNLVANDVFIHHIGSASHAANDISIDAVHGENSNRFFKKWGSVAAPIVATRWADYDRHIALLKPSQYSLPGWAIPEVSRRSLARHLAKISCRLGCYGWRAEGRAAALGSMRWAITVRGLTNLVRNLRPS